MIFGTRKKGGPDDDDDEMNEPGECDAASGGGASGRRKGKGKGRRRRKPLYRYGANRADMYMDPRMWKGTGSDIEGVWFPLEGGSDGAEEKRVIWENGEADELSYGKEAIFLMEEPRHAHC